MSTNAIHYLIWALWLVPALLIFVHILDDMKSAKPEWKTAFDGMKELGWSKTTIYVVVFVCVGFASLLWPLTMAYGLLTGVGKKK